MKYIVKDATGQVAFQTLDHDRAAERSSKPGYKLIAVPVSR